jgi:hypothetical protein
MTIQNTAFQRGWWSFGIEGIRESPSTYSLFDYDTLPKIEVPSLDDASQWLPPLEPWLDEIMSEYRPGEEEREHYQIKYINMVASANRLNISLPADFHTFMQSLELQDRIPSCTACYFDISNEVLPSPFDDGGYFVRFLNDQQWVMLWYLYIDRNGNYTIVNSPYSFDPEYQNYEDTGEFAVTLTDMQKETRICAPNFTTFIYRFWLENQIWFALNENKSLSIEQEEYIRQYNHV